MSNQSTSTKHVVIDARIRETNTGKYALRLIQELEKLPAYNTRYTVIVRPESPWEPSAEHFSRAESAVPQFSLNPINELRLSWQLYRLKPDLVHFTMTQQPLSYFGKIATTTHDLTMFRFVRRGSKSWLYHKIRIPLMRFLYWWSHRKSNAIIVPTDYVAADLAEHSPFTESKIVRTYEAGEPARSDRPELIEGVSKPYIMHVGSPFPHKNINRLVQAFQQLKPDNPELKLVLAGRQEFYFRELIDWYSKLDIADDIITPGWLSEGQMRWLYNKAEAYVLPSLSEGFGLPGLEAMAHDTPVVCSNATCLPEVYGNSVEYFDPKNTVDMADKISQVIGSKELARNLRQKGKQQINKYSWAKMAKETQTVYLDVLSKS